MKEIRLGPVQAVILLVAAGIMAGLLFIAGTRCGYQPGGVTVDPGGVDAGPGEQQIADQLDAAIQRETAEIERLEREYQEDIDAFDRAQREKYEQLQEQDLDDMVRYLQRWHEERNRG